MNNHLTDHVVIGFHGQWPLARTVAAKLGYSFLQVHQSNFTDGEVKLRCPDFSALKGRTIILFPPALVVTSELFFAVSFVAQLLKQIGVRRIIGVVPYVPFSRQERSIMSGMTGGGPLYLIISWFKMAGINQLITVWLHSPEVVDLAALPINNICAVQLIVNSIKYHGLNAANTWLIAPDRGALGRVKQVAQQLNMPYLMFEKQRDSEGTIASLRILAPALEAGAHAIIIDDIIATGSTALRACRELRRHGFMKIYGWFVHPVFAPGVGLRLRRSSFEKIFVTNSIFINEPEEHAGEIPIEIYDMTDLLAQAIKQTVDSSTFPHR